QYEREIDLEVSPFGSAGGLAVLSTWSGEAVLALVDETDRDPVWNLQRLGIGRSELLATLQQIRKQGYAFRIDSYPGETSKGNRLRAIARPVTHRGTAMGALVILWPRDFLSPARFAEIHLKSLSDSAAAISADLDRLSPGSMELSRTRGRRVPGTALYG